MKNCIIKHLLENSFSRKSFVEKQEIVRKGRLTSPLPNLKTVHKDKGHSFIRNF